mmetsp:Transcript_33222/g.70790  ORF Transcript_33222/g.70790 Transcript_33222/m.70790 type:complete len:228 (+) Transcript_33222:289-972(+)
MTDAKTSKRKSNDGKKGSEESRPNKKSKVDSGSSARGATGQGNADRLTKKPTEGPPTLNPPGVATRKLLSEAATGGAAPSPPGGGAAAGAGSSLIPSMPVPVVERHLDSLASPGQLTPRHIARKCLPLVKKLINHEDGWVFKDAVDPVELGIPDYFDIVEYPMDLTLVANKLEDGAYKDIASFEKDTKLVFENAILFNGEDSDVGSMAKGMLDTFATDLKNTLKGEE